MIAIKSSEWARKVVWTFMGCIRIGAESCFGLHGGCLNGSRDCCVVSWAAGDGPQGLVWAGTKKAGYRLETTLGEYPAKRLEMRS